MEEKNQGLPSAGTAPVFPPEYKALAEERVALRGRLSEIADARRAMKKAAMEAAGWTRCCRCWPSAVADDGYCGCCDFNHATGKRLEFRDPDYFGDPVEEVSVASPAEPASEGLSLDDAAGITDIIRGAAAQGEEK